MLTTKPDSEEAKAKEAKEAELLEKWEKAVSSAHEPLAQTHKKKEFSFSATELRQLVKIYTIETIAHQTLEDKLNNDVLPRLGITSTPQIKVLYDLSLGRFVVWTPREKEVK